MHLLLKIVFPYLLGSVNFAYVIGKLKGVDISQVFDRNLGGMNLYRATKSIPLFLVAAILDIAKVAFSWFYFGEIGAVMAYLGHAFSFWYALEHRKIVPTGMGYSSIVTIFALTSPHLLLIYVFLEIFHKVAVYRVLSEEVRIFGSQLYHFSYVAFAILIYSFLEKPQFHLLLLLFVAYFSFLLRWKEFIASKVVAAFPQKELEKLLKDKVM